MNSTSTSAGLKQIGDCYHFNAPAYEIIIGPDGNVYSLVLAGTSILGGGPDGKSGAFFINDKDQVIGFSRVAPGGPNELVCTENDAEVRYQFFPDRIAIRRGDPHGRFANWVWLPSKHITRSLDARYDTSVNLVKPEIDALQATARWVTDTGSVVYMPG